jgi:hypothetical protein
MAARAICTSASLNVGLGHSHTAIATKSDPIARSTLVTILKVDMPPAPYSLFPFAP